MRTVDFVLKNAKLWTPGGLVNAGLAVKGGRIVAIAGDSSLPEFDQQLDAKGNLVIPGFVDEHTHMEDPNEGPDKEVAVLNEDFAAGTMAAAAGGVTTIIDMPDCIPPVTNLEGAKNKLEIVKRKSYVDFSLHGGFKPGSDYAREIPKLYEFGLTGLKTWLNGDNVPGPWPGCNDGDLYEALKVIHDVGGVALIHAENDSILSANEKRLREHGRSDMKAYLESRPAIAEIEAVHRVVFFLKQTRAKGLVVHTSVPEGVLDVREAKQQGYEIFVETCPQYLFLTEDDAIKRGPWLKFAPPVRDRERMAKMWQLLNLGYIDTLGSDHGPFTKQEKLAGAEEIWKAPNGLSSIEATLPLMMDAVNKGRTSLQRVIQVACENPAKLFELYPRKGALQVGSDADFVVVDMKSTHKLSNDTTKSKCGWIAYDGTVTQGAPKMTFVRGTQIMENGKIIGRPGYGEFVTRNGLSPNDQEQH